MNFEAPKTNNETGPDSEDLTESVHKLQEALGANRESDIKDQLSARRAAAFDRINRSANAQKELENMIEEGFFQPTEDEKERWHAEMPNARETAQQFLDNVRETVERDI